MPRTSTAEASLSSLISLALSGCIRFATEVRADGSGVLTTEFGYAPKDKALLAELTDALVENPGICGQVAGGEALPAGSRLERQQHCVACVPLATWRPAPALPGHAGRGP